MSFLCLSPPGKPKSIIHHIGQLGSKVHQIGQMGSKVPSFFAKKEDKKTKSKKEKKSRNSKSARNLRRLSNDTAPISAPCSARCNASFIDEIESICGSDEEDSAREIVETEEDFFVSLDQNELLMECFMTNECSDTTFIVHFCAEDSTLTEDIEDVILIRAMEAGSNCQCRRVNSRSAPLFTAKLGIDPEQPTIVAIRNGDTIDRISNISSSACLELEKWISDTEVLTNKPEGPMFPSMNTHSC